MKEKSSFDFRSMCKFTYKEKKFEMFANDHNKLAFLEIDLNGKYHYPQINDVMEITYLLKTDSDVVPIINDNKKKRKPKKMRFIPKAIIGSLLVTISLSSIHLLGVHGYLDFGKNKPSQITEEDYMKYLNGSNNHSSNSSHKDSSNDNEVIFEDDDVVVTITDNEDKNAEEETYELDASSGAVNNDELNQKYLDLLALADDELDYKWANDYENYSMAHLTKACDSKAYEEIFGFSKPTEAQLDAAVMANSDIPAKYKEFVINYIHEWMSMYPDSDMSVFYHNLKTLKIIEADNDGIMWAAVSTTAIACYRPTDNAIYINENSDCTNKTSDDYIVLSHELTHAARMARYQENGNTYVIKFYDETEFGSYIDEALDTHFMYELQGLNKKSTHYTLASSYIRIILDCLGDSYTGSDYMNHSVNYLAEKMDEFMGDEEYAYHIIALIESEMTAHYTPYITTDYDNFDEVFDYLTRMYMKKHLNSSMSYSEAKEVFDAYWDEVTNNFENLEEGYDEVTQDKFLPTFEECCEQLGIEVSYSKGL